MKTGELIDLALDWAVTKCKGVQIGQSAGMSFEIEFLLMHQEGDLHYSTDWSQGGPIIEREGIELSPHPCAPWWARKYSPDVGVFHRVGVLGPTPLIAAMRCYVASKLGDTVDIPPELLGEQASN
jgi:hypothetical protein